MTTTVQCVQCRMFSLQKHGGMAQQGFGVCLLEADTHPGRFESATFQRRCTDFAEALPAVIEKRVLWLQAQREEG
ncbi:hypothetical protein BOTU111921_11360 [Bordetella tumbae]|uniref:hypothetical protein n=1 Tax=Bordetella tumbae TaxID=1649139 RepID=UPI0039EE46E8